MGSLSPQQSLSLYSSDNPFRSDAAYRWSNYSAYIQGSLVRLLDWREPSGHAKMAHNALRAFVSGDGFSCVGAKGALTSGGYRFGFYDGFPAKAATEGLARDLAAFVAELPFMKERYKTFIAVFNDRSLDETGFEVRLWEQLQALHEVDRRYFDWSANASSDPADRRFAFSAAGHPFFIVGMHQRASRISRRFALPALVFNSREQFDALKQTGHFQRIAKLVREREMELQGSLNPNLAEYGELSEARQYSGRAVEETWKCPFHRS